MEIKFVNYTGSYPNLCSGVLTLLVNGKEVTFGPEWKGAEFPKFWASGGSCGFAGKGWTDEYVNTGRWFWSIFEADKLKEFLPYKDELMEIFNLNVPFGCCGGCL